jgi:hypothetical protein
LCNDLINSTKNYLGDRDWGESIAVTLNMKQGQRYEDPEGRLSGSFYVPLDEYRINQNLRHFCNLLNRACFGNNWRRNNKRLNVVVVSEAVSRKHLHLRISVPYPKPRSFKELRSHRIPPYMFVNLIAWCWNKTEWGYGKAVFGENKPNDIGFCDEGWGDYLTKKRSKENYDLAFPWEVISLPAKAS